jgi:phosphoesterase RecJ-like protein
MAITSTAAQALATMQQSNHTLICFPEALSGDGVGASLGLATALEKLRPGHQVDVVSSAFHAPQSRERFSFLPGVDRVRATIEELHDLTIRVRLQTAKVKALRYDVVGDALEIHLTPSSGHFSKDHVETAITNYRYDCIVTIGCPDLTALGTLYTDHAAFFQSTPIVNIDCAPENERYGQINLVDIASIACGEICATFLREVAPEHLDADVATCFLTGILARTRGFRAGGRVTPRTLETTAALLAGGARQDDILTHLFQTKTVGQLKLWGRALTRLRTEPERKLVWTLLAQGDFLASGASEADLLDIVDELLASAPDAGTILLIYEQRDRTVCVIARTPGGRHDAAALLHPFGGAGNSSSARACLVEHDLLAAERVILDAVRKQIDQKIGPTTTPAIAAPPA